MSPQYSSQLRKHKPISLACVSLSLSLSLSLSHTHTHTHTHIQAIIRSVNLIDFFFLQSVYFLKYITTFRDPKFSFVLLCFVFPKLTSRV